MPDPAAAHARRGAPWTFDAAAFLACLRAVRHQTEGAPPGMARAWGSNADATPPTLYSGLRCAAARTELCQTVLILHGGKHVPHSIKSRPAWRHIRVLQAKHPA